MKDVTITEEHCKRLILDKHINYIHKFENQKQDFVSWLHLQVCGFMIVRFFPNISQLCVMMTIVFTTRITS